MSRRAVGGILTALQTSQCTSTLSKTAVLRRPHVGLRRTLATAVESAQGVKPAKGTAIVLLNMGGPQKTSEVNDFLSALFVSLQKLYSVTVKHGAQAGEDI